MLQKIGRIATLVLGGFVCGTATQAGAPPTHFTADAPVPATIKAKRKMTDKEWKDYPVQTVGTLPGFADKAKPTLDKWGGRTDKKARATGYFHAEKIGDRWWMVDPDGGLFIHVGVVSVSTGRTPTAQSALQAAYGTPEKWATQTTHLLHGLGFNGVGAWSDTSRLRAETGGGSPLMYTVMGSSGLPGGVSGGFLQNFGSSRKLTKPAAGHAAYPNDCIPVFAPGFAEFCDNHAKPLTSVKNDPYLVGYYSDNEIPAPRLENYLKLDLADPNMGPCRLAAQKWLDARKNKTNATVADITDEDKAEWMGYVYDRYFAVTTGAIRKYDPNHLCLGSRLYASEKRYPETWHAAGRYLDVVAINHYGVWTPQTGDIAKYEKWSGKPVMITEFYAKGMDSGFANTGGAGWLVATQRDRGLFYQTFTLGLLESKVCVGWHWFKYQDNDPTDKSADPSNQDSNKGLVTNKFTVYEPLAHEMKPINENVYALADYFDSRRTAQVK